MIIIIFTSTLFVTLSYVIQYNHEKMYVINTFRPIVVYILVFLVAHYSQSSIHVVYDPHPLILNPKFVIHHAKIPWLRDSNGPIATNLAFLTTHKLLLITHCSLFTAHKIAFLSPKDDLWIAENSLASQTSYRHNYMPFSLPSQLHKTNHKTHSYSRTISRTYTSLAIT